MQEHYLIKIILIEVIVILALIAWAVGFVTEKHPSSISMNLGVYKLVSLVSQYSGKMSS